MSTETTEKAVGQQLNGFSFEEIGDDHLYTGLQTPMKATAFKISDDEKKKKIAGLFKEIMEVMGFLRDRAGTRGIWW